MVFGQRERVLRYDIAAMLALEEASDGKPTGEIVSSLQRWSFTAMVLLLWAGFRHEDKSLTQAQTRRALEAFVNEPHANIRQLRQDITNAIEGSAWYRQIEATTDDDVEQEEQDADANP
jgi:hypothetical protein